MVCGQPPFKDLATISSYSNDVTSVWLGQIGSQGYQKLGNGYNFFLL
jgi:hypothetical protein